MNEHEQALLEEGTVVEAHEGCLAVEVDGVELYVGTHVHTRVCDCCGAFAELRLDYNRHERERVEEHGEVDPLDLYEQ
jgi:hypothetical protein